MLVLSRHRDESILIGDDVIVTVVDIRGDKVRLGVEAPAQVAVDREEVRARIEQDGRARPSPASTRRALYEAVRRAVDSGEIDPGRCPGLALAMEACER